MFHGKKKFVDCVVECVIIFPGMEITCKIIGVLEMIDINKLKEDKKQALAKLDNAMNACSPESVTSMQNERKMKTKFLSLWKDYKNNKIKEHKFLQISNKFAEILSADKEMRNRLGKIIRPLLAKYEKTCKILRDLEEQS